MKDRKLPFTNRRKCGNYWPNADMQKANREIREAHARRDPSLIERAREFRDSVMHAVSTKWKAVMQLKMGRLQKLRGACAAGDQSRAWAILKDLVALDGASDDTKRKASRAYARRFPAFT